MKKILSALIAFALIFCFASCSGEKNVGTSSKEENASSVQSTISTEDKLSKTLLKVSESVDEITDVNDAPILRAKECYRWLYYNFKYRAVEIDLSNGYTDDLISELADYYYLYHKGSCEHYAVVMMLMLKSLGFDAQLVEGERYDSSVGAFGEHVWVIVKVYDKYYHVDGLFGGNHTPDLYSMFCVSDDTISSTHKWNGSKYPVCSENLYLK